VVSASGTVAICICASGKEAERLAGAQEFALAKTVAHINEGQPIGCPSLFLETRALLLLQVGIHKIPIDQMIKEDLEEVRTTVLIIEIVSVLPDIHHKKRSAP